jgi:hypothetical protein
VTPSGSIRKFDLALFGVAQGISAGPDGNVWFTLEANFILLTKRAPDEVGRLTVGTGDVTLFTLPEDSFPVGITSAPDGNLWFAEWGRGAIGRITPAGSITEFRLPQVQAANIYALQPTAITAAADGRLWFLAGFTVGLMTTTGDAVEFPAPNSFSSMATGPDGNVWSTDKANSKIVRIAGNAAPGGNANLVWRQTQTGDLALWSLSGLSIRSENQLAAGVSLDWQVSAVGDLDGNGTQDLVWRHTQTGDTGVWLMDGGTIMAVRAIALGVPLAWQIVGVADLNGDGKADLVWRNMQSGDLGVWFMDGATVKREAPIALGVPLAWQIAGLADMDGDGKADIVWRNAQSGDVGAWLMNGAAVRSESAIAFGVPGWWQIAGIADSNGDGKADLLWRSMQNGDVGLWLMNGTTIVDMRAISLGVPLDWRIVKFLDVDGDGRADVVWRHDTALPGERAFGEVTVWLLDGATLKEWRVLEYFTERELLYGDTAVWQIE